MSIFLLVIDNEFMVLTRGEDKSNTRSKMRKDRIHTHKYMRLRKLESNTLCDPMSKLRT